MKLVLTEKVSKIVPQVLNRNIKSAVHSLAKLLPSTLPGKVCPIVGWNLHAGKLNVECKTRCRRKAWTSSSRGAPFFATLYDFFTAEQAFLLRGRHSFLILRDKPNPLPCCTLLLRSPFRPARTFCAALLSLPGSSNPRQNGSWQIVMCDGRLQTKADLVYAQDFVPKSGFLAESEAKITFKGSSKSLKKSHPVCSCGPRCPSHYRNDQRKAYWLEITLNFVHSCSRNMYDFNFIPCVAWNVGSRGRKLSFLAEGAPPALSIPSLIFRRIPSCRTSAPSPLTV